LIDFDDQRQTALWDPMIAYAPGCSPDEYPPAVMIEENDGYSILTSMARTMRAIENKMSAKPPATQVPDPHPSLHHALR
jgi:chitinase